jgi:hypothetical protein
MKKYTLLIFAAITFIGCEVIEDNSPGLQTEINDVFFRANDARAAEKDDGSYVIQGYTQDEILTLSIKDPFTGIYELGAGSENFASFEDALGNLRVTSPFGGGQVEIVPGGWDAVEKTLTGTFNFTTITPGVDTLTVASGIFYKVPYAFGLEEPIQTGPPNGNAGTFVASVDNNVFTPSVVTAVNTDNAVVITGATATVSIAITFPLDTAIGLYSLPRTGFQATYTDINGLEQELLGNVIVIGNDEITRRVKGTFSFQTENHEISQGQFNVVYN